MKRIEAISALALALILACGLVATLGNYTSNTGSSVELNINAPKYISIEVTAENLNLFGFKNSANESISIPKVVRDENGTWYTPVSIGDKAFYGAISVTSVSITAPVTSIGESAFSYASNLKKIVLPDDLQSIGRTAFYGNSSLTSISIPNGVTSIGYGAFNESGLTSVTVPGGVTTLECCFYKCPLTSAVLTPGVSYIGEYTFAQCSALTKITIPSTVHTIGAGAFQGCGNLKDIYFGGTEEQWNAIVIADDNGGLLGATIHYGA